MQYLLPCTCGEKVTVTPAQAGLSVRCQCGKELLVPTVRGLNDLQRVDVTGAERTSKASTWGPRQSLLSLGAFIMLSAAIGMVVLVFMRPLNPSGTLAAVFMESMSPPARLEFWRSIRDNERAFDINATHLTMLAYKEQLDANNRWMWIAGAGGAIGLAVFVFGCFAPRGTVRA